MRERLRAARKAAGLTQQADSDDFYVFPDDEAKTLTIVPAIPNGQLKLGKRKALLLAKFIVDRTQSW